MITAPACLRHSRVAITPALRAAMDRLDHNTRFQVAYHFGWVTADGAPASAEAGKAVRPALALLSAEAVGAAPEIGLPGAVAVELVHNFSLIHDDLMDGDEERRHRPAVWKLWGTSSAILTGDALLALAQEVLLDSELPTAIPAARLLARTTRQLIRGQVLDVAFERRPHVSVEDCIDMAAGKTGALLSASVAIGAVLAGAPEPVLEALRFYGTQLGLAFQLIDDILGIWGDPAVTGKPVHSDLRARKNSLPISYALNEGGPAGQELATWLCAPLGPGGAIEHSEAELLHVAGLIETAGGRQWAAAKAAHCMEYGQAALESVELDGAARDDLIALGHFIVNRKT